jgi:hypothetical protein
VERGRSLQQIVDGGASMDGIALRKAETINALVRTCIIAGVSCILLIAFLIALFGNLHLFLDVTGELMRLVLAYLTPGVFAAVTIAMLYKSTRIWRTLQAQDLEFQYKRAEIQAVNDANKRRNDINDAEVERIKAEAANLRAEAQRTLMTHDLDAQGNKLIINPWTNEATLYCGNMREHPGLHSMHYTNKVDGSKATEALPALAGEASKPSIDEIVNSVKRNSYEFVLGRSLQNREFIREELTDAHIKLIGGSRMGKSCEAAAIIDQVTQTHDVQHLQIALLDLEYKTSRLFEHDEHILTINTGYKKVQMHAKDVPQVADCLILLHDEMQRRYQLTDTDVDRLPHILIYLEEFLYWKKLLKQFVSPDAREKSLAAFAGLATRGLKVGIHLMACAQVDYADEELRDAMAQFLAINVAFSVKPSAAMAAGFVNSELLRKNYEARTPGQFVVEAIGGSDLGVAPEYNVKAKLAQIQAVTTISESQQKASRNPVRNTVDTALQAKLLQVMEIPGETMAETIKRVWYASPGNGPKYQKAKQEYLQVIDVIHAMARRGLED